MGEDDIPEDERERAALICSIVASEPDIGGECAVADLLGLSDTDRAIDLAVDAYVSASYALGDAAEVTPECEIAALAEALLRTDDVVRMFGAGDSEALS